jgi:hypothetical protein
LSGIAVLGGMSAGSSEIRPTCEAREFLIVRNPRSGFNVDVRAY